MSNLKESIVRRLPYVGRLKEEIASLKTELRRWRTWQPPGHFYSPIPSQSEVLADTQRIFGVTPPQILGVDLNRDRQLELLGTFATFQTDLPEAWKAGTSSRYRYVNDYYSWADGIVLFCMLRYLSPKRVIEVGSGFSSAVILDTDEMFFNRSVDCTFIEPYPDRLHQLLRNEDKAKVKILEQRVQDVDTGVFASLGAGDILLIDSSHVSKVGSDVNHLLFEVLPTLAPGVYVHFHDIFYPFEYPEAWVREGVAWNEAYLLHAFLQYNTTFAIQFFTSYLMKCHREAVTACLPMALNSEREHPGLTDAPGASLWLSKT